MQMKKIILFATGVILFLVSCKENEDTETPLPKGIFFRGTIQDKNKSITVGVNGFVDAYFDSVHQNNDTLFFTSGIKLYQGSSGYYISTKEKISFELVNIPFLNTASNKDSLWHVYLLTQKKHTFLFCSHSGLKQKSRLSHPLVRLPRNMVFNLDCRSKLNSYH